MDPEKEEIKQQSVTLGSIFIAAINGIVGYIAVYFFKPLWDKVIKWWHNDKSKID